MGMRVLLATLASPVIDQTASDSLPGNNLLASVFSASFSSLRLPLSFSHHQETTTIRASLFTLLANPEHWNKAMGRFNCSRRCPPPGLDNAKGEGFGLLPMQSSLPHFF
jgi:hypothetical protein